MLDGKGWDQTSLAAYLGCHRNTVAKMCRNS